MADFWKGYFIVTRNVTHVNEANWALLIDELDALNGASRLPNEMNHNRGDMDMFNNGDEETPDWYSNCYIYTAKFNVGAVSFDKFKNRLINLFDVPEHKVTYATSQRTIRNRPSVTAIYSLQNNERLAVELLGCVSDSVLCTWQQSNDEVLGLIYDDVVQWGEVIA